MQNYLNDYTHLINKMAWGLFNEIGRKIIHITILIVLAAYFLIQDSFVSSGYTEVLAKQAALIFLVGLLTVFLILEYFRLELNWKMPFFSQFIRAKEQNRMYGVIYFLSATIISLAVFNPKVALAALLMTTFGDMDSIIQKINVNIYFSIVTLNSKENFGAMLKNWNKLIDFKFLNIIFINPFSETDKKWIVFPCTHNKICDESSLESGLKSIFETVEIIDEQELADKLTN